MIFYEGEWFTRASRNGLHLVKGAGHVGAVLTIRRWTLYLCWNRLGVWGNRSCAYLGGRLVIDWWRRMVEDRDG